MTPEILVVLGVGIELAGLILNGQRNVTVRMDRLENRMDKLETGQAELRERMAYPEGLLEGLREAIVHRAAAWNP